MLGITQPVRTIGDKVEGSHLRNARGEGVDLPIGAVELGQLTLEPLVGNPPGAHHKMEEGECELRVSCGRNLPIIRHLAHFPETLHIGLGLGLPPHVRIPRQQVEHHHVGGRGGPRQARFRGQHLQGGLQTFDGRKIERRISPLQHHQGIESMGLDGLRCFQIESGAAPGGAEGPVLDIAPGPPGDLAEFAVVEGAVLPAIEFAVSREGDVIDVEVEPHADGVGGDDVIDLAGLIERHLGVAGARAQGPQHHRRPAALAANQFGDGVDLLRREGDDGAARGQAREPALACKG